MSIVQTLTEGIVQRDMAKEGQALLNKWSQTGLLEGLTDDRQRSSMARLLENQAKELLREASTLAAGDVEGFAAVAFPIVRRVFAGLIANELVSVQPMSLPSGLIFFLDFVYSPNVAGQADQTSRMGNDAERSIYGTDKVASQITGGVNLVGSQKETLGGPRQQVGYAYASATGSSAVIANSDTAEGAFRSVFKLDGSVSETRAKYIQYDPDLLASTDDGLGVVVLDVAQDLFSNLDTDNLSAIAFSGSEAPGTLNAALGNNSGITKPGDASEIKMIRRLTKRLAAADAATTVDAIRFVFTIADSSDITAESDSATAIGSADIAAGAFKFPLKDTLTSTADKLGAIDGFAFPLEGAEQIPEIDIKVDSIAITATTKKLKAKWTPELGQDLNAYHNLDAEVELTSILSEQIALEIDREILADLVNGATAATFYWSRSPGLFVNRETGAELGATAAAPDFTGTVSEWYETLIETINDVSAQIHRKTLRGGANYVVCSPEVANILEFTSGFRANVTADADKGEIGAVNVGSLSRKFDVIVDPYFPRNALLVGRKGGSFLESGYVYAPYVPLQTTPTIFGVEDFVPRKGVMTRYAKKMVRPDMYGLVIVRGLLGESGAS
jgi:hypothetical protein